MWSEWIETPITTQTASYQKMLRPEPVSKLFYWAPLLAAIFLLHHGCAARCGTNTPTVRQIQVGFGKVPKFSVEVQNSCPMCPAIDIHLKCGAFSQALVNPKLFKVVDYDDCVVNSGLPLAPLQKISFNYTHTKFLMSPRSWYFQCE